MNKIRDATKSIKRDNNYPAFRFTVDTGGEPHGVFTECTLPTIEWDVKELKEGGVNDYVHQLPGQRKKSKLVLKQGIGTQSLLKWCKLVMGGNFKRQKVTIKMLNSRKEVVVTWVIEDALPVKWTGPQFKSGDNTIAIHTVEFVCGNITVE